MTDAPPPIPPSSDPDMFVPYATPMPSNNDVEHLRLLAIFHWVVGPIQILMGCLPIMHVVMGILMLNGKFFPQTGMGQPNQPDMSWMGWVFIIMGSVFIVMGWTFGVLTLMSGFKIKQHRGRIFSIVVGALNCIHFPFGTGLGIFTLIVLLRRSVENLYRSTART